MKYLAVLLCMSGLTAVCLGQNTTTANATTAAVTTVSLPGSNSTAVPGAPGTGPTDAATTNAAGGGATGGTAASGTTAAPVSCLNCTGASNETCGGGVSANIGTVTCAACWVYRDESTASGEVTITRGCALEASHTCNEENKSEQCDIGSDTTRCRRCCTLDECNDETLEVTGNGAADVHVSIVVTMASALFAILALWQ